MDILIGNELISGASVYLAADGQWVEDLQQARTFSKDERAARDAAIEASRKTGRIVGVEVETVAVADGRLVPQRLRETIRSTGPTTPAQDRQHLDEDTHVSI